jgi:hypothetical protein
MKSSLSSHRRIEEGVEGTTTFHPHIATLAENSNFLSVTIAYSLGQQLS